MVSLENLEGMWPEMLVSRRVEIEYQIHHAAGSEVVTRE